MRLIDLEGRTVVIHTNKGKVFAGVVGDYVYPEDNDDGRESIVINDISGYAIELRAAEIETVKIFE